MRVVGSAAGISIRAPDDSYFSYFNSPYVGHYNGSAIDIYPRHQLWHGDIITPVSGEVIKIKKMKMGQPKDFPTSDFDYGIGILPEESNSDIVRIMHCEPSVSEGEIVDLGDKIGNAIRSRYFNYWTGPHYHVEIVPLKSFERSTKSYPLELVYNFKPIKSQGVVTKVEFLVSSVTEDYIIGYAENLGHASIGDLVGLPAISEDYEIKGILDGGLSHYRIGGVIGSGNLREGSQVFLLEPSVGTVRQTKFGTTLFNRGPSVTSFLDTTELRGISCFIYSKHYTRKQVPQLILIPKKYGQLKGLFAEGNLHEFRIMQSDNTVKAGQVI